MIIPLRFCKQYFCFIIGIIAILNTALLNAQNTSDSPLKVGIVGLSHDHVHWIFNREDRGDIKLIGIAEPNQALVQRYSKWYNLDQTLFHSSLKEMLDKTNPDAVLAFNPIYEHLEVVKEAAPRGIHVMVEKPLAVSVDHAQQMKKLAEEHNIQLLTNYETTWYASNQEAHNIVHDSKTIGPLRKIVVHDGHQGPKEIGISQEFLQWLTDPVKNGGGAIIDFGCYGANLITWLMKGQRPSSITAVTKQIKPDVYPKVDDDANIILTYPETVGIIQASWNWPVSRKDMELYGKTGYIFCDYGENMRIRENEKEKLKPVKAKSLQDPYDDPFAYFAAIIKGKVKPEPFEPSSLENNMIVVEILELAKKSASKGKTIKLK
ncbi:Gfo/Idh/MocA family oxidoreductase [Fulvivirgaceae bacterium BMA10]|uniref:Gfo/Idh/MocA family oxidoreductase n=1 Tax=Splendidivirga corallicola TaxID=3051826 RepID=A0ABT8KQ60_9BACT|nr:Gfo/Idh/MocA family oxidoreductase [Fulvivirgaceae bacterium BMA10]